VTMPIFLKLKNKTSARPDANSIRLAGSVTPIRRAVFITNIPAPYREQVHELVASQPGIEYTVIYCAHLEPNRQWQFELGQYRHRFLGTKAVTINGQTVYLGMGIIKHLNAIKPDVVITGGFAMPMLMGFLWAKLHGAKHVAFSDSHLDHERNLSFAHRLLRRCVYGTTKVFLGPSNRTHSLFNQYQPNAVFFQTQLCADNERYAQFTTTLAERDFDVMFCGRICTEKKYPFFVDALKQMHLGRPLKILVVGDGPDRAIFSDLLQKAGIEATFTGFLNQDQLPAWYARAKILFFPSARDAWGIVANEAMAVGTPVITCPETGVAGELVMHEANGYVLALEPRLWGERGAQLLLDSALWSRFSAAGLRSVTAFTYQNAAAGIIAAINYL
jgi:glycosyltransferase involved in cell wall biosynthesis